MSIDQWIELNIFSPSSSSSLDLHISDGTRSTLHCPLRDERSGFFFSYDTKTDELIEIPPLPGNGRMGFGLAATETDQIIGVGGHNFDYETLTSVNLLDVNSEKLQWKNLPDMPSTL